MIEVANITYTYALGDDDGDPATPDVQSDIVMFELTKDGADEEQHARLADLLTHVFWNAIYSPPSS